MFSRLVHVQDGFLGLRMVAGISLNAVTFLIVNDIISIGKGMGQSYGGGVHVLLLHSLLITEKHKAPPVQGCHWIVGYFTQCH